MSGFPKVILLAGWLVGKLHDLRRAFKSWTVNWGVLLVFVGYFNDNIEQVLPFIKQYIPNDKVGLFVMFVGLVVVALRIKTTKPLSEK